MSSDLYQIVDMRRPEADGLEGLVEIDEGGRHILPLVEDDAPCDMCGEAEAELIEIDDGVVVAEQATYTVETAGGSGCSLSGALGAAADSCRVQSCWR